MSQLSVALVCKWLCNRTSLKLIVFCALLFIVLILNGSFEGHDRADSPLLLEGDFRQDPNSEHVLFVLGYLEKRRELGTLTPLASQMYMMYELPPPRTDREFKILIWKVGKKLENRHLKYYTKHKHNPYENCSVNNCKLTYEDNDLDNADAIVFHLQKFGTKNFDFPDPKKPRPKDQLWIFMTDEAQNNTFSVRQTDWTQFNGVFNWSMSYKATSDVPVPCGRIIPLDDIIDFPSSMTSVGQMDAIVPYWDQKQRQVMLTNVMSNCGSSTRLNYIKELGKHIPVDTYGQCGSEELRKVCPFRGYGHQCNVLKNYVFYLSFHNSNCDEFIDEKVWTNGYAIGNIPIIMGSSKKICDILLPPNSFIHVEDFENPAALAKFLKEFNNTFDESMYKYHKWRRHFDIEESSGYAGARSRHYCRLCEALNYNDLSPKVYDLEMLRHYLDPEANCYDFLWKST